MACGLWLTILSRDSSGGPRHTLDLRRKCGERKKKKNNNSVPATSVVVVVAVVVTKGRVTKATRCESVVAVSF